MSGFPTVYHGTCVDKWGETSPWDLYVTNDPESAKRYAAEWAEEGEEPLVLRIDAEALAASGLDLQPNAETVEQYEQGAWGDPLGKTADKLTWQDTLALNGTFCIAKFKHGDKAICIPHEMASPAPGM